MVHVLQRADAERDESQAADAQLNGKEADDGTHNPSEDTTLVLQPSGDLRTKVRDKLRTNLEPSRFFSYINRLPYDILYPTFPSELN